MASSCPLVNVMSIDFVSKIRNPRHLRNHFGVFWSIGVLGDVGDLIGGLGFAGAMGMGLVRAKSRRAIFMTVWLHPSEILGFVQDTVTKYMISTILVLRAMT